MRFIQVLEEKIGRKAEIILEKMQPGDVLRTYADVSDLEIATSGSDRQPA